MNEISKSVRENLGLLDDDLWMERGPEAIGRLYVIIRHLLDKGLEGFKTLDIQEKNFIMQANADLFDDQHYQDDEVYKLLSDNGRIIDIGSVDA